MPLTEDITVTIACDNPACPGNTLDPADRTGWLFISHEVYGEPVMQHVFCCYDCLGTSAATVLQPMSVEEEPVNA
jgi:hypothetical protein